MKEGHEIKSDTIELDGQKINFTVSGTGAPSIVFLSGHRIPLTNWKAVLPSVSQVGTVLAYDRLDTGGSGKSNCPQNGDRILSTLNALLESVGLDPPHILVAHSLGGLYANLYARRYPDKVAAVVFVDAGHPSEADDHANRQASASGIFRKILSVFTPDFKKDPNSEFNNVVATVGQINQAPPFPNKKLVVITGATKMPFVPEAAFKSHLAWQKKLVTLSDTGYQVMAEKSGHVPQISEPDLVAQVIIKTAEDLRLET